jgi:tetratricopeptide (TPR) repeat protein
MKTYIKILMVLCTTSLISCDDYIDVDPKGQYVPESYEDYRLLLNGDNIAYSAGNTYFASDDARVPDEYIDMLGDMEPVINKKIYTYENVIYDLDADDQAWTALYKAISTANIVLDAIPNITDGTEVEVNQLKGEALVHRASSYLSLVNLYAMHYQSSTAANELGVPLLLTQTYTQSLNRASVAEVYEQILSDLNEARDLMSVPASNNVIPSEASVYAYLARTNLFMGNYAEALQAADKCLQIQNSLNDYNDYMMLDLYGLGIPFPTYWDVWYQYDAETILAKMGASDTPEMFAGYISTPIWISTQLNDLFDENDLRYSVHIRDSERVAGEKEYMPLATWDGNNMGITVPEILLTRAECHARNNQVEKALDDLHVLREKRFPMGYDFGLTANTKEEALALVLEERRKEMLFKGVRLFDIKRLNAIDGQEISIERISEGKNITIEANSFKMVFPIGDKIIAQNPEIEQNKRAE